MSVRLDHTIVHSRDNRESADFLAHILGLEAGAQAGPFVPLEVGGVTLDFASIPAESIVMQHYAFLVSEDVFTAAFARIREGRVPYFADPHMKQPGEINHHDGGRGVYFLDPSGHGMELITRRYGSGG
ncbi:VOC family protein [Yinghuangia soli]|uniref:VOC family protein n=1 Tax=Yinghuangia soli TaxID=2908204 RepID=A0AA41Q8K8_9ACTN|nr:VOC family protein [Yinghuangia soli]MCF2532359.1 VOC family protein [Yinghuangia soli]